MKKNYSILNKIDKFSNRLFFSIWFAFHFSILLVFLAILLFSKTPIKIDSDLYNMLPNELSGKALKQVDKKLSEVANRNIFILSCNKDFDIAKNNLQKVYNELKDSENFQSLYLFQNSQVLDQFEKFIFENRFNYIKEDVKLVSDFSCKALEKLYSPFTYSSLEYIDKDPFLLTEMQMENLLNSFSSSATGLTIKDNVLAREFNGNWYVLLRGVLSIKGSALASSKNGIAEIYSVCSKYENNEQRFVYSGTTFHAHKSSNAASKEITIISIFSIVLVLLLLIYVFRTPLPIFASLASITISLLTSFIFTVIVFHKIHVLTLVFGTTLIGSCIDYSFHFFINWKANTLLKNGSQIRKFLFSGILLSFISTEICFAVLLFAPFELLKQMSVFSLIGILSSFLSVVCIYPLIPIPQLNKRYIFGIKILNVPKWYNKKIVGRVAISVIFILSFIVLGFGYKKCAIKNDLSKLYKMEGRILKDQIESAQVLSYLPKGWFIVSASTEDELIVYEKDLVTDLKKIDPRISVLCTSTFLPSKEEQNKSKKIYEKLLPFMEEQLELIGEDKNIVNKIYSEWEEKKDSWTTIKDFPEFIQKECANSWLGKIDGKWYSVILPSYFPENLDGKSIAKNYNNHVFYENKVVDISHDLDILTVMIAKFFAIAYILIFLVLLRFYDLRQVLKIVSIPLLIIIVICSVFSIFNIHLEFFSITGIILVFGLGLDYIIYMTESQKRNVSSENKKLEPYAVFLSFLTTIISFGAISLSSFVPVHLIGLAISIGLATAFLCSFFYARDTKTI